MITLSSEKGLIHVENWDEIETRPGFVKNLNPAEHKLKAIIGRYIFPAWIQCGLSNCHTRHVKGYIVVTESGHETNIGKDCGKKYFGVDFETLSKKFDDDLEASQNRELLANFAFRLEELEGRIATLRAEDRGADWINRTARTLTAKGKGCPDEVVQRINAMVRSRDPAIAIPREATDKEIEVQEEVERRTIQRPYFISENVGNLSGLEALFPENDLRNLLVIGLGDRIKEFRKVEIQTLTSLQLREWSKWTAGVEATLDRAMAVVEAGRRLLTADNIGQFSQVMTTGPDLGQFRGFIRQLGQG